MRVYIQMQQMPCSAGFIEAAESLSSQALQKELMTNMMLAVLIILMMLMMLRTQNKRFCIKNSMTMRCRWWGSVESLGKPLSPGGGEAELGSNLGSGPLLTSLAATHHTKPDHTDNWLSFWSFSRSLGTSTYSCRPFGTLSVWPTAPSIWQARAQKAHAHT